MIDDDASVRVSLGRLLQSAGLVSNEFASADDFLAFLKRAETTGMTCPANACAIVDVHMPGMSGLELMRSLRRMRPKMRVVLITASTDARDRAAAVAAGVTLLQKPFDDGALFDAISVPLIELPPPNSDHEAPNLPKE